MPLDTDLITEIDSLSVSLPKTWASIERCPSGSLALDEALNGGWPVGRFCMIAGNEGCGKTMLMLMSALNAQRLGKTVAIIDTEHSIDTNLLYRSGMGKPNEDYYYLQPYCAEDVFDSIRNMTKHGVNFVVWDSFVIATRAEIEGTLDDNSMALFARKSGDFFRRAIHEISEAKMTVLFSSQIRTGIGSGFTYDTLPGGKAKNFYSSIRIYMDKGEPDREFENDRLIGMTPSGLINKNKNGPSHTKFKVHIRFSPYIMVNIYKEIIDLGIKYNVFLKSDGMPIKNKSAIFYYNEQEIGKGEQAVMTALSQDETLLKNVIAEIQDIITNRDESQ